RGPSRIGDLLRGERPSVCRHADGLADVGGRKRRSLAVSRSELAPWLDAGRVRIAGGIEMRRGLLLLFPFALAEAQSLQEAVLAQGEKIFNQTCAAGYCHGAKGVAGGAPRLAARGFDQAFINATVMRGVAGTSMTAFAN